MTLTFLQLLKCIWWG